YLDASLQLYKELGDEVAAAGVYKELAELRLGAGDYLGGVVELERSVDQYISAAAMGKNLDDLATSNLADVAGQLFLIYELQGREADAIRVAQNVERILPDEYKALFMLGRGLFQLLRAEAPPNFDDYERVFELLTKLPVTENGDVEGALAGVAMFLSVGYSMQGDYTKAAHNLRRAREFILKWKMTDPEFTEFGDLPGIFVTMIEAVFYGTGSAEEALVSRFKKILPRISQVSSETLRAPLPLGELDVPQMLYLASIEYLARGDYERSLQCLLQAQGLAASDDKVLPILINQQLTIYYSVTNDKAKALEQLKTGIRLSEELHGSVFESAFGRLMLGMNLAMLASTYDEMENYGEARKNSQKLLDLLGPFKLFNFVVHKSMAETYYDEGKYADAIKELDKAIALAKKVGFRFTLWEMYQLSGRAHWRNGEPTLARRDLEASVAEIEAMRRTVVGGEIVLQHFFEDKLLPYHDLIEILLLQGDCAGAFVYAERSKSRVLLDALKRGRKYARNSLSPLEQAEEGTLRGKLIMLNRQIAAETSREAGRGRVDSLRGAQAEARLDYELFRAKLYVAHPELATAPVQETVNTEGLRDLLHSPETALLEYVVTGYSSHLFVISAEPDPRSGGGSSGVPRSLKCSAYPLKVVGDELEDKVNDFRVRVGHPEGVLQEQARALYDLLLRPAQEQIVGKKTLIIVPDGILWEMPFQALKPTSDHYLVQESLVYYAPSFTALREMRLARQARAGIAGKPPASGAKSTAARGRRRLTLLAIGNPLLSDAEEPLTGTGELAKRIKILYGEPQARVYTEAAADEERFKSEASDYQVIHIATHGVLDNENPMYSYVMLFRGVDKADGPSASSPDDVVLDFTEDLSRDGFLEAWEIMDLELNARLVVLSACETARGRVGNGEGLVGFSWALFIAGTPTTVVSQWKVPEQGTNELMYSFHENFVRSALSPPPAGGAASALQKASLKLMESTEYKHPYYWAGFVVIGDGS
ncbi:MAG TPA: CHAT domain-containing tetratricopeptide repeat protein, partial [Pyrinomonadaceae bacterium]